MKKKERQKKTHKKDDGDDEAEEEEEEEEDDDDDDDDKEKRKKSMEAANKKRVSPFGSHKFFLIEIADCTPENAGRGAALLSTMIASAREKQLVFSLQIIFSSPIEPCAYPMADDILLSPGVISLANRCYFSGRSSFLVVECFCGGVGVSVLSVCFVCLSVSLRAFLIF